jgi:3alpha(or 20beta)-hydroxysteroid dehydrogenase
LIVGKKVGRVDGKTALVTGAAHGIGAATARLLATEGASVLVADIDASAGLSVARDCGGDSEFIELDVTEAIGWAELAAKCERRGSLEILVNNAGLRVDPSIPELSVEEWDRALAVNVRGVFLGVKYMLPMLRAAERSSIVNIGSIAAVTGFAFAPAYQASKGAVCALTRHLAVSYARDGIRANCLHPGTIDTRMSWTMPWSEREAQRAATPLGRFGSVGEIAQIILFLASGESSFMTGAEIVADGGYTAQ